jgi:hypothetical protein
MPKALQTLLEYIRRPEDLAAVALLIQAGILAVYALIFRKHARTADRISEAIRQQGKILDDQTKIMEEQFKFQRRVEAAAEKQKVFDLIFSLQTQVMWLESIMESPITRTLERVETEKRTWDKLSSSMVACEKALLSSTHLSQADKQYFLRYAYDVSKLEQGDDLAKNIRNLKAIADKYHDFVLMLLQTAQQSADF